MCLKFAYYASIMHKALVIMPIMPKNTCDKFYELGETS